MNHKSGFNALSRTTAHRKAMLRNLVTSLFRSERITTTKAKALEARRFAEKLITRGKTDSVHNRRQAARFLFDSAMVDKLFTNIGPRMKERNGGYTRILKLGFRNHDNAELVLLELVDYEDTHDFTDGDEGKGKDSKKAAGGKSAKAEEGTKASKSEKAVKAEKDEKPVKKTASKSASKATTEGEATAKKAKSSAAKKEAKVEEPSKTEE